MYCPVCGAEYRPGFTVCSDCQVALVPDPPRASSADPETNSTSFVTIWSGDDPGKHAGVCELLDRQRIPARTVQREDRSFNLGTQPAFEVYVPSEFADSAREALAQARLTPDADSGQVSEPDSFEIPAGEGPPYETDEENYEEQTEQRGDPPNLDPLDATVEVWSGQDADVAAMIALSLRENHITYRSEPDIAELRRRSPEMGPATLFVFPENEAQAKEIVQQIVNAAPPE